jgi:ABC-type branched-subunit amino acid transport system ATPase component
MNIVSHGYFDTVTVVQQGKVLAEGLPHEIPQ